MDWVLKVKRSKNCKFAAIEIEKTDPSFPESFWSVSGFETEKLVGEGTLSGWTFLCHVLKRDRSYFAAKLTKFGLQFFIRHGHLFRVIAIKISVDVKAALAHCVLLLI